jgi:hypothetical protein
MITELTRLCPSCRATLPDPPAPAVCPRCATVAVPHIRDWDPRVRYFLTAAYASRHAFLSFDSAQAAHEKLLMSVIAWAGEGKFGHPFGHLGITCETRAADCYPLALQLAIALARDRRPARARPPPPDRPRDEADPGDAPAPQARGLTAHNSEPSNGQAHCSSRSGGRDRRRSPVGQAEV